MTFSHLKPYLLPLALFLSSVLPLKAQIGPQEVLGESDAVWTGVKLQITKLIRIDPTHVLAAIHVMVASTGPALVYIGDPPPGGFPPLNAPPSVAESEKYQPIPFNLTLAKIFDEDSKQEFKAEAKLPDTPFLGPNSMITSLNRNCGVQMGVLFRVPPPQPPDEKGIIPPQLATFLLPKAKHAIQHVILPLPAPAIVSGTKSR